jgi:hypothetical protein
MPDEPTFPKDAAVGNEAAMDAAGSTSKGATASGAETDPKRKKYVKTGVAVGIGSAAIVAALLYANRGKKNEKGNG